MTGLGSVLNKARSLVPKVVNAGKQAVNHLAKKVTNSTLGKAVASIPALVKAGVSQTKQTVQKAAAAVPKIIEPVKKKTQNIKEGIKEKGKQIKDSADKKINEVITDIQQRNGRILDKVKAEWEKTTSNIIRGTLTTGAIPNAWSTYSSFALLDFLLQSRKAVIEEYPIMNWPFSQLKSGIETIKTGITDAGAGAGSYIYNLNIPGISDYVGELTDQRGPDAKSNVFSVRGAFARGVVVDGVLGTVDGLANLVADPFEAIEGLNTIMLYPDKTLPAICSGVKDYVNTKIIHGSPEDRAEVSGQAVFEVASWFIGAGEAKTGIKAADTTVDMTKTTKVIKAIDTADELADTSKILNKPWLKNLGKTVGTKLDNSIPKYGRKIGDVIDNMRMGINRMTNGPALEYAGVGRLDDISKTGDKIEDLYTAFKKSLMKVEESPGKHVNIKPKVESENISKLVEDTADAGKSGKVVKGTGDAVKGGSKIADDIVKQGQKALNNFDINSAYVKPKHLSSSSGNGAKFLGDTKEAAEVILKDAMSNGTVQSIADNGLTKMGQQSYQIVIDAGKEVGTKGETLIKIVISEDGGMLSAYPVK